MADITPSDSETLTLRRNDLLGLPLNVRDTAVLVLLAAAADACLYDAPGGAGSGALLVLSAAGLLVVAGSLRRNMHRALLMVIALTAVASAWNDEPLLAAVGWAALFAFAIRLRQPQWTISETAWTIPQTIMLAPLRLLGHAWRYANHNGSASDAPRSKASLPVRAVLIPLLTCLLFALIFIAANPVIERLASQLSQTLGDWVGWVLDLVNATRVVWWIVWLGLFAALLRPAVTSHVAELTTRWRESLGVDQSDADTGGDFISAAVTLVCVNLLFLLFNAIDSIYLYFKADLPDGITFSEYSHRGCFWLTIALALTTFVIGVTFKGRLNFHPRRKTLVILTLIWAVQNLLLAAGALRRLQMYIDYNGLTRQRIVGIYGVVLVVVGLIVMVRKVRRAKSFAWLIRRDMLALWVALIALALTPRDLMCWNYNVTQIMRGNMHPLTLLHGQPISPEGLPALIPLLDFQGETPSETDLVRTGVAGMLGRRLVQMNANPPARWTQWQGARRWAVARLETVRDRLDTTPRGDSLGPEEVALRAYTRQWW